GESDLGAGARTADARIVESGRDHDDPRAAAGKGLSDVLHVAFVAIEFDGSETAAGIYWRDEHRQAAGAGDRRVMNGATELLRDGGGALRRFPWNERAARTDWYFAGGGHRAVGQRI